jgi:uncharacterized protein with GYD domain
MPEASRMPRYDVRNDGIGPYAVFYCEYCDREYRSQPEVVNTVTQEIGKKAMGGFLRNIPLVGGAIAESVTGEDPRYSRNLTPQQIEKAWGQVKINFRACPTCLRIVCLSDFDEVGGYCNEDSPRRNEIAQAQAEQAGAVMKGFANVFGLGEVVKKAGEAAKRAATTTARCPNDGTLAPLGTKFCPECGTPMIQPTSDDCPNCGTPTMGAKFCPECGTKIEVVQAGICLNCGVELKGAKFCPECGTKVA